MRGVEMVQIFVSLAGEIVEQPSTYVWGFLAVSSFQQSKGGHLEALVHDIPGW
jgi:hypothetical protein